MSQPSFDFGDPDALAPDDGGEPTYSVAELADAINDSLRRSFFEGVWVRGEIDGLVTRGPHTYFSLVERSGSDKAVLNVQLFAPMKNRLTPLLKRHRLELRNGMKVRIHGHLDFWAAGGRLGLKMAGIDPRYTLGEIAQRRDEILRRLVASGLLDRNAALALSTLPLRVGVVASVDSAAWHDFHDEMRRSGFGFELTVCDTRVQGEFAVPMIAGAIGTLDRLGLDVIVVIRGGGARNELAVFDAEEIAVTIAACRVPVLTGLGHEIDRSVADEVAHTALKTPTACAGALIERVATTLAGAEHAWGRIATTARQRLDAAHARLTDTAHRLARATSHALVASDQRLDARARRIADRAPRSLDAAAVRCDRVAARLEARASAILDRADGQLDVAAARTAALDPAALLARGWTITKRADGSIVRGVDDVALGEHLTTLLVDGTMKSTVTDLQRRVSNAHDPDTTNEHGAPADGR